ncbi:MAG TPA: hypothetical protein ENH60_07515 [Pricia sp.]|nr:hypothetical protein [Pricia sp.]
MDKVTITDVIKAQRGWFSNENKVFFGDKVYDVNKGGRSEKHYLVRLTQAWTDMFDGKPKDHFRVNELDQETLKIGKLLDDIFLTVADLDAWLRKN